MTKITGLGKTDSEFTINSNKTNSQETAEKDPNSIFYSEYDSEPKDGTVSIEEQKDALLGAVMFELMNTPVFDKTKLYKKVLELINLITLKDIQTDGTEKSAQMADEQVEKMIREKTDNIVRMAKIPEAPQGPTSFHLF